MSLQESTSSQPRRVVSARTSLPKRLGAIWQYRELLVTLVRKDLKVRYKDSALGFLWSMANPAAYLAVYYVVFTYLFPAGMPRFAIYLLTGLLVWNFFITALLGGTGAILANASIVKKVSFPREILVLSTVGSSLVHFVLQAVVLLGAMVLFRHAPDSGYLLLVPVALLTLVVFVTGLAILLSALNVYVRDTQHLLEIFLFLWFFATPVIYRVTLVTSILEGRAWLLYLNPVTPVVLVFQRAFYNITSFRDGPTGGISLVHPAGADLGFYLKHLAPVGVLGLALILLGMWVFGRLEGNFAEEL
ncbi:MAG TPA: ABC transporter permease [Acidimicrobiales bacterium]|nr:ABC transporter permease [Acidimicrobiales bacterium]